MNKIIYGFVASVLLIGTFYFGSVVGENSTKDLLLPQINDVVAQNASLKEQLNIKEINMQNLDLQIIELEKDNKFLEKDIENNVLLQEVAIQCFWASEFQYDKLGSIQHFDNINYSDYYISTCATTANDNWELLVGE